MKWTTSTALAGLLTAIIGFASSAPALGGCADGSCNANEWKSVSKMEFAVSDRSAQRLSFEFAPTRRRGGTLIMDLYRKVDNSNGGNWVRVAPMGKYKSATQRTVRLKTLASGEYAVVFYGAAFNYKTQLDRQADAPGPSEASEDGYVMVAKAEGSI